MTDAGNSAVAACLRLISLEEKRPSTVVYDPKSDWDDVRACEAYFESCDRLVAATDESLWTRYDCFSFLTDEALRFFLPSIVLNCILFRTDDLIEAFTHYLERRLDALLEDPEASGARSLRLTALESLMAALASPGWDFSEMAAELRKRR
jgi:hypothetical protein